MSCRTYPLEFTGEKYQIVDSECPGIDEGEMSKEERVAMRDLAKKMNQQLTQMRIITPIFSQAMQPFVLNQIISAQKQYMDMANQMSPEEREKFEKEMQDKQ